MTEKRLRHRPIINFMGCCYPLIKRIKVGATLSLEMPPMNGLKLTIEGDDNLRPTISFFDLLGVMIEVFLEFVVKDQHERATDAPPEITQVALEES